MSKRSEKCIQFLFSSKFEMARGTLSFTKQNYYKNMTIGKKFQFLTISAYKCWFFAPILQKARYFASNQPILGSFQPFSVKSCAEKSSRKPLKYVINSRVSLKILLIKVLGLTGARTRASRVTGHCPYHQTSEIATNFVARVPIIKQIGKFLQNFASYLKT